MSGPEISLRLMELTDVPAVLRLKDEAGWNQLPRDLERFLACSPRGCFVAECEGNVVGGATTTAYERKFAWVGMVLVDARQRRKGIGRKLLGAAIECAADCETVKLDATPEGKRVYDTLGFVDEYELERWVRPAKADAPDATPGSAKLQPLTDADLPALCACDAPVFGAAREFILRDWLGALPAVAWQARNHEGRMIGYLLGREGSRFRQLGPLVADDEPTARALLSAGLRASRGLSVMVDIPLHTASWPAWLASLGFERTRQLIRMYRGPNAHPGQPARQWTICGPEWG